MFMFLLFVSSMPAWSQDAEAPSPTAPSPTAPDAQPAPVVEDYYSQVAARLAGPTTSAARMEQLRAELLEAPGDDERGALYAVVEVVAALDRGGLIPEDARRSVLLTALRSGPAAGMTALNEALATHGQSPLAASKVRREELPDEPMFMQTQVCAVRPAGDYFRLVWVFLNVNWSEVWDGNTLMADLAPGQEECWEVEPGRVVYYALSSKRRKGKRHGMRGLKCGGEPFEFDVPAGVTLTIRLGSLGLCPTMKEVGLSQSF